MSEQIIVTHPFFQPRQEYDTIQVAYFLMRMSEKISVKANGCWEWDGCRNRQGYGSISSGCVGEKVGPRIELVHRVVHKICTGLIPKDLEVCHSCDNPPCCNPSHLFLGSHFDNMQDAARKKRIKSRDSRGEKNPSAKLTIEKVIQIRERVRELSGIPRVYLVVGKEYGVSPETISRVVNRKIWAHVP